MRKFFVVLFALLAGVSAQAGSLSLGCWDVEKQISSDSPLTGSQFVLTAKVLMGDPSRAILRDVVYNGLLSSGDVKGKLVHGGRIERGYLFSLPDGLQLLLDEGFKTSIYAFYSYLLTGSGQLHPAHPMGLRCITHPESASSSSGM